MVGRGEFAYLVADTAQKAANKEDGGFMMSKDVYVSVMWALLIATVVAPVVFRRVLVQSFKNNVKSGIREFTVRMQGHHHTGVLHEVCDVLHSLGLDVCSAHVETDGVTDIETFLVKIRGDDPNDDLSADKMDEIRHSILEAMNSEAQVILAPVQEEDHDAHSVVEIGPNIGNENSPEDSDAEMEEVSDSEAESDACSVGSSRDVRRPRSIRDYWLEIKILGDHHPDTLDEILNILYDFGLDVVNARIQELGKKDVEIFHVRDPTDSASLPEHRRMIRERVCTVFKAHGIKGEVMVKVVSSEQASHLAEDICLPSPRHRKRGDSHWRYSSSFSIDEQSFSDEDLIEIIVESFHDKRVLSEIVKTLHTMHLDVHKAEIVTNGDEEVFEFIVDDNQELSNALSLLANLADADSGMMMETGKKKDRPRSLGSRIRSSRNFIKRIESFKKRGGHKRSATSTSAGRELTARLSGENLKREVLEKRLGSTRLRRRSVTAGALPKRRRSFMFDKKDFKRARRAAIKKALRDLFEEKSRNNPDIPFHEAKITVRLYGSMLSPSPQQRPVSANATALEMKALSLSGDALAIDVS